MRIVRLGAAAALALAACAKIEPPTGGPEDRAGPELVVTRPDTLQVVPQYRGAVVLGFSERLSEQRIEEAVMVSPRTSPVVVDHDGSQLRVSLRRGWQPGLIYHVTVLPLVQDLFNNRLREAVQLVFSTGPAIPRTEATGVVLDRLTAQPDTAARVEAIRTADSLVYAVRTDSAGAFRFAHLPAGEYRIRAFRDQNRNRALDPFEPGDTARATIAEGPVATVRLSVVAPDSTPPRAASASVAEAGRVEVRFDDYLDPAQTIPPAGVQIVGPDGTFVPVSRVGVQQPTTARADTAAAGATPTAVPSQTLEVELAEGATLAPGAKYRVTVRGVRNVVGLAADAETELTAPATPPAPPPGAAGPAQGGTRPPGGR